MNYQTINAKIDATIENGSQYSVAKTTGVNHALISKMISGELTNPTLNKLIDYWMFTMIL